MRTLDLSVVDGHALVDGSPLALSPDGDPAAALIAHAQEVARTQGTLHAHLRDGAGTDTWVRIDPDGSVSSAHPPVQNTAPSTGSAPPSNLSAWSAQPDRSRPRGPAGRLSGLQGGAPSRRALILGAGALGVGAAGAGLWAWAGASDDAKKPSKTTATTPTFRLPDGQSPPSGWSPEATWRIENVADPKPQIDVRDNHFAVLTQPPGTGTTTVTVASSRDGRVRWHSSLAVGESVTGGPLMMRRDGRTIVLVVTMTRLLGWDLVTGRKLMETKLPVAGGAVGFSRLGPWIAGGGNRYYALVGSRLRPFDIPAKSFCFGTVRDRMLVVAPAAQVFKLESGKPKLKPGKLAAPKGTGYAGVVAVTERILVMAWSTWGGLMLRAYDLASLKVLWTTPAQPSWQGSLGTTRVAPSEGWATVGNRHVDLTTGRVRVIAAKWAPIAISDTHAWGSDGTYVLACDSTGRLVSGRPEAPATQTVNVVAGVGGNALVVTDAYGTPTMYSLPRR